MSLHVCNSDKTSCRELHIRKYGKLDPYPFLGDLSRPEDGEFFTAPCLHPLKLVLAVQKILRRQRSPSRWITESSWGEEFRDVLWKTTLFKNCLGILKFSFPNFSHLFQFHGVSVTCCSAFQACAFATGVSGGPDQAIWHRWRTRHQGALGRTGRTGRRNGKKSVRKMVRPPMKSCSLCSDSKVWLSSRKMSNNCDLIQRAREFEALTCEIWQIHVSDTFSQANSPTISPSGTIGGVIGEEAKANVSMCAKTLQQTQEIWISVTALWSREFASFLNSPVTWTHKII